jgi:hypothetical protein
MRQVCITTNVKRSVLRKIVILEGLIPGGRQRNDENPVEYFSQSEKRALDSDLSGSEYGSSDKRTKTN